MGCINRDKKMVQDFRNKVEKEDSGRDVMLIWLNCMFRSS